MQKIWKVQKFNARKFKTINAGCLVNPKVKRFSSAQFILILATTDNSIYRSTLFDPFSSDTRSKSRKFSSHEQRAQVKGPRLEVSEAASSPGWVNHIICAFPARLARKSALSLRGSFFFARAYTLHRELVRSPACPRHCSFFLLEKGEYDLIFIDFYAYSYLYCTRVRVFASLLCNGSGIPYTRKG